MRSVDSGSVWCMQGSGTWSCHRGASVAWPLVTWYATVVGPTGPASAVAVEKMDTSVAKTAKFEDRKHREEVKGAVAEISDRGMDGGLGSSNG